MKYYRGMASTMANISKKEKQNMEDYNSTVSLTNRKGNL